LKPLKISRKEQDRKAWSTTNEARSMANR